MIALVSKVNPPQQSNNGGYYQKIEFYTQQDHKLCYTYVSPEYHNWERWEKIINAPHGIYVSNINWKDETKRMIDADSPVIFNNKKYEKLNDRKLQLGGEGAARPAEAG